MPPPHSSRNSAAAERAENFRCSQQRARGGADLSRAEAKRRPWLIVAARFALEGGAPSSGHGLNPGGVLERAEGRRTLGRHPAEAGAMPAGPILAPRREVVVEHGYQHALLVAHRASQPSKPIDEKTHNMRYLHGKSLHYPPTVSSSCKYINMNQLGLIEHLNVFDI